LGARSEADATRKLLAIQEASPATRNI
jgi:hypothetical protein